jgi:peptidoglycan hydrolase CwlO-like protein
MSPEVASGATAAVVAMISGSFLWHTQKDGNKVSKINTVLVAYDGIVKNLQAEIDRMKHDLEDMRSAMDECEKRNSSLATEVALLREQVEGLGESPVKNDEQVPKKKAAPRKQAARKPKGG